MSYKKDLIRILQMLPDDCSLEEIHRHYSVWEMVRQGQKAVAEGRVLSQEEVEKKVNEWAASSGLNRR